MDAPPEQAHPDSGTPDRGPPRSGEGASWRWWLNLQLGFAVTGGAVWLTGAILEQDFVAGVGCGLLVGALLLRLGRKAADGGRGG